MGQTNSCAFRERNSLLNFFNKASESELLQRYPWLSQSLAETIIRRRQVAPFHKLSDVSNIDLLDRLTFEINELVPVTGRQLPNPTLPLPQQTPSSFFNTGERNVLPTYQETTHLLVPSQPPSYEELLSPRCQATATVPNGNRPPPASPVPLEVSTPPPYSFNINSQTKELLFLLENMGLLDSWSAYTTDSNTVPVKTTELDEFYRFATWNLNRFTMAKAKHPGFREAICLTILRNSIDLVAFQEVSKAEAVQSLVDELNDPKLPTLLKWVKTHRRGVQMRWSVVTSPQATGQNFQGPEYSSFLFRQDRVKLKSHRILGRSSSEASSLPNSSPKCFTRDPFIGKFTLNDETVMLISVHLKAAGLQADSLSRTNEEIFTLVQLVEAFSEGASDSAHLIILGDFNLDPGSEPFGLFRGLGLNNVIDSGVPTMLSAVERESRGTASCLDNAWLSPSLFGQTKDSVATSRLRFGHEFQVVNTDLRHPLIPSADGAGFNGYPSDHCPIVFNLVKI